MLLYTGEGTDGFDDGTVGVDLKDGCLIYQNVAEMRS